ncbi:hypothetical protein FWF89_00085 [Candidatus Saccharibacteria bacterium]|nr:hypothetical protein [Candidatus Saccharibacteria bacterium]
MAEGKKKSNKIVWLTAGIVAVVAVAVLIIVLVSRGDSIKTIAQFKEAVAEKRALNCTISSPDSTDTVMQATEGFKKIKLTTEEPELSTGKIIVLIIDGEGTYFWDEPNTMAFRMDDRSMLDDFLNEIDAASEEDDEEDEGFSFKCESPNKANFEVPSDIDFIDFGDLFDNDYDDDDYYFDEDGYDYSE